MCQMVDYEAVKYPNSGKCWSEIFLFLVNCLVKVEGEEKRRPGMLAV